MNPNFKICSAFLFVDINLGSYLRTEMTRKQQLSSEVTLRQAQQPTSTTASLPQFSCESKYSQCSKIGSKNFFRNIVTTNYDALAFLHHITVLHQCAKVENTTKFFLVIFHLDLMLLSINIKTKQKITQNLCSLYFTIVDKEFYPIVMTWLAAWQLGWWWWITTIYYLTQ